MAWENEVALLCLDASWRIRSGLMLLQTEHNLLSRLLKKSVYSAVYHVQAPGHLLLHIELLDYSMRLYHGSKSSCCSSGETVKFHGSFQRYAKL